jgi:uncharacterized membrane protein
MSVHVVRRRSRPAAVIFKLFNPVPFGFFVAALIFDVIYSNSGEIMWMKSAAWLIALGLIFAIIPRLINLGQTWFSKSRPRASAAALDFWLNLFAIVAAIFNAFVHSRDAYAVIPEGMWLSVLTVVLLCVAAVVRASYDFDVEERGHA